MKSALLRSVVLPGWQHIRGQDGLRLLRDLERTQWLSAGELEDLRWRRVGDLLEHAAAHVPYYAKVLRELGTKPESLIRERSLARLPLLDRATVSCQRELLRATNVPLGRFVPNGTGGSTGEPLRFFDDLAGFGWSTAAVYRAQRWLGIDVGDRCAYLWGSDFDLSRFRGIVGRVKARVLNMLLLPAWDLCGPTAPVFWRQLMTFRPRLLVAYAESLHQMARLIGSDRERLPGLQAIIVSAELLTDEARATIEACFKVPVYDRYGGRDITFVAQECPMRSGLHINAENVLVEIVKDGRQVPPGEMGEIVITRLENYAMPFVRYRTGDLAVMSDSLCACGRSLPLLQKLEGRVQDSIATSDGRTISGLFFAHMFKDCPDVKVFQIHQLSTDRLLVVVVLAREADFISRPRIERLVHRHLGSSMTVEFEVREQIPLTPGGKRRIVVSHLDSGSRDGLSTTLAQAAVTPVNGDPPLSSSRR